MRRKPFRHREVSFARRSLLWNIRIGPLFLRLLAFRRALVRLLRDRMVCLTTLRRVILHWFRRTPDRITRPPLPLNGERLAWFQSLVRDILQVFRRPRPIRRSCIGHRIRVKRNHYLRARALFLVIWVTRVNRDRLALLAK